MRSPNTSDDICKVREFYQELLERNIYMYIYIFFSDIIETIVQRLLLLLPFLFFFLYINTEKCTFSPSFRVSMFPKTIDEEDKTFQTISLKFPASAPSWNLHSTIRIFHPTEYARAFLSLQDENTTAFIIVHPGWSIVGAPTFSIISKLIRVDSVWPVLVTRRRGRKDGEG